MFHSKLICCLIHSRSQTQHQYKVRDLSEEIRDLELDESNFESGGPSTPEIGEVDTGDMPTSDTPKPKKESNKDNSLFGLLQSELVSGDANSNTATNSSKPAATNDSSSSGVIEETTNTADATNSTDSTSQLPPTSLLETSSGDSNTTPTLSNPINDHLDGLLSLLDAPLESFQQEDITGNNEEGGEKGRDEWDSFMEQQQILDGGEDSVGWGELVRHAQNEDDEEGGGVEGWSKNILEDMSMKELENDMNKLLSLDEEGKGLTTPPTLDEDQDESFDPLASSFLGQVPTASNNADMKLDPSLFQLVPHPETTPLSIPPPLMPQQTAAPPPLMLQPIPQPHPFSMNPPSLSAAIGSGRSSSVGGNSGGSTVKQDSVAGKPAVGRVQSQQKNDSGSSDDKKKKNWMNLFAHLDPLANEKV